ncbi:MAG: response regulator [Opitutaceae bacterium]|nr:response regulator [Opitutaceae bacterium]
MEFRTPYVPGYAMEVDCLVLLWTSVVGLWVRRAWRAGQDRPVRMWGAWWMLGWLASVTGAVSGWIEPTGWRAEEMLETLFRAGGTGILAAGVIWAWRPAAPPSFVALAGGAVTVAAGVTRHTLPYPLPGVFDGALLCMVLVHVANRMKSAERWRRISVGVAIGWVAVAALTEASLEQTLWPGLLTGASWSWWRHLAALAILGPAGLAWWVGTSSTLSGRFSLRTMGLVALSAGGAFAAIAYGDRQLRWRLASDLRSRMAWAAAQLQQGDILALYRREARAGSEAHRRVWLTLTELRRSDGRAMYAYLMALRDGRWCFPAAATVSWVTAGKYVDVDFRPGAETDAWVMPGDRFSFLPPSQDNSGLVVTAVLPIWVDGPDSRILLGVDYDALAWTRQLLVLRLPSMALLLAGGACGGLWLVAQRRSAQVAGAHAAVAAVSHELRTPLQSVLGYADLLARTDLGQGQRTYVERLRCDGRHLAHLINQMLDLSTLRAGVFQLRPRMENPVTVAADALASIEAEATRKGLTVRAEYDESLPPRLLLDGVRVRQVVVNLLSNAVRYTERGGIVIRLRHPSEGELVIEVEDPGIGMDSDDLGRLFDPFFRGEQAARLEQRGAGLGLSITRQIIDCMRGTLEVHSEPGAGSLFRVTFPVERGDQTRETNATAASTCRLEGWRVLVVEDHPTVSGLFCDFVTTLGGVPSVAASVAEARAWLRKSGAPDVLVIDHHLADGSGFAVALDPVVVGDGEVWRIGVSATDGVEIRRRASEAGCDHFLPKPCDLETFSSAIAARPWLQVGRTAGVRAIAPTGGQWVVDGGLRSAWLAEVEESLRAWEGPVAIGDGKPIADRAHYLKNGADFLGPEFRETSRFLSEIEALARAGRSPATAIQDLRMALMRARALGSVTPGR